MKLTELLKEIELLAQKKGFSTPYIVGGLPRDKVLNRANSFGDIDITTGDDGVKHLAKEVAINFHKYVTNYMVMSDGHAQVSFGDLKMDFSSNFIMPGVAYLLRKSGVSNVTEMQKEIYSRDFTCNTLLMDFALKEVKDPTGKGVKDINDKIIRTCLSPALSLGFNDRVGS